MISSDKLLIILVHAIVKDSLHGMVVYSDDPEFDIGEYAEDWALNDFIDYHGEITLIQ